jgi:DNA-binding SARP family transcriptional activator
VALYTGEYLPDDRYSAWAESRRAVVREHHRRLLLHHAALCMADGANDQAETDLRHLLADDPAQEGAARALMLVLARTGRRAEALHIYARLRAVLAADLGVAPDHETQELAGKLRAGRAVPPPAATAASGHSDRS